VSLSTYCCSNFAICWQNLKLQSLQFFAIFASKFVRHSKLTHLGRIVYYRSFHVNRAFGFQHNHPIFSVMKAKIEKIRPLSLTSKSFCNRCGLIFAICWGLARFLAGFRSKACFQLKKAFLEHFWWISLWQLSQTAKNCIQDTNFLRSRNESGLILSMWAFTLEKTGWLCWKIKGSVDVEPPVCQPKGTAGNYQAKCFCNTFFISG